MTPVKLILEAQTTSHNLCKPAGEKSFGIDPTGGKLTPLALDAGELEVCTKDVETGVGGAVNGMLAGAEEIEAWVTESPDAHTVSNNAAKCTATAIQIKLCRR